MQLMSSIRGKVTCHYLPIFLGSIEYVVIRNYNIINHDLLSVEIISEMTGRFTSLVIADRLFTVIIYLKLVYESSKSHSEMIPFLTLEKEGPHLYNNFRLHHLNLKFW